MRAEEYLTAVKAEITAVDLSSNLVAESEDQFYKNSNTEDLKGKKQDRKERKKYANVIFKFIICWCAAVLILLFCTGFGWCKFDNSVIITLITTTTANILALFVIVAKYLFFREGDLTKKIDKQKKNKAIPTKL